MVFRDMNQSWIKPEGTVIDILEAGPCLQVVFASPLLVEHIQKLYPWCRFSICGGDLEMGNWTARFYGDAPNARDDKPFSWSRSYQDTAPLAIVHAALGAVPSIRAYLATL